MYEPEGLKLPNFSTYSRLGLQVEGLLIDSLGIKH